MKVMIVEDDAIINLSLRHFLMSKGWDVIDSADTYDKAMNIALEKRPDVILMDIQLKEDKSGMDAALELKKHYDPYIIFCTAYNDPELLEEAEKLKCPYFIKPLQKDDIHKTIINFKKKNKTQ
ncbi:response regulator [Methanobacterium alcaliphilum]|uniref:response regulator n=1 Tax=Methanobacterium alcaliphilum TaxID=392018 RepID=UPI00200A9DCC|nr:response regulator [Methanobacterium alcaliphilum]MCK9152031.1 response regulator [Methanobacterium alcaliphilum]